MGHVTVVYDPLSRPVDLYPRQPHFESGQWLHFHDKGQDLEPFASRVECTYWNQGSQSGHAAAVTFPASVTVGGLQAKFVLALSLARLIVNTLTEFPRQGQSHSLAHPPTKCILIPTILDSSGIFSIDNLDCLFQDG